jgi:hypothetical protein
VLRRIFGPKRDVVSGELRKLHSKELHNLYSSPDIIRRIKLRRMRWVGHVACVGQERKVYKVLVGKLEGKRPLKRPRHRGEDWIRMELRQIGWCAWMFVYESVRTRSCVWSGFTWRRIGTGGGLL